MVLTGEHYIYIIFMVIILISMIMKKESVVPCILGIFFLGLYFTNSFAGALNGIFNSFVVALNELGGIILIIGIMVALSKALEEINAINFMVRPFAKVIKNPVTAFFATGIPVESVINQGMPLFWIMGIVTIGVAFYMLRKDMKNGMFSEELAIIKEVEIEENEVDLKAKIPVLVVGIAFILDIVSMFILDLKVEMQLLY